MTNNRIRDVRAPLGRAATPLRLVIDIGKTHAKVHLLDNQLQPLVEHERDNRVLQQSPYPHFDTEALWQWLCNTIRSLDNKEVINAICITTHGAAAALVNRHAESLVLPILDYECVAPESVSEAYARVRPDFRETFSPDLPLGLNLGRQLFWLEQTFPQEFARATNILLLPQYWAWRFSGLLASECSSLGCHTDLWDMTKSDYSSLVDARGWRSLFPPLKKAWDNLGPVRSNLAKELGLSEHCQVHTGIHDSNASLLRYLRSGDNNFALVSSGTWTIAMASGTPLERLDKDRDMLANCDALGRPIACSRFMGGREYANICSQLNAPLGNPKNLDALQRAIDSKHFALPDFSHGSGPFPNLQDRIIGGTRENAATLATLYCALMIDVQLDLLDSKDVIIIEGSFLKNPFLIATLAQLRAAQSLYISDSNFGTVRGCALLADWQSSAPNNTQPIGRIAEHAGLQGLEEYKMQWRKMIN